MSVSFAAPALAMREIDGFALGQLLPGDRPGWSRRRALSRRVHRRHRHHVVGHVVHVAVLVDVNADPGAGDRLAGVILLVRHVFAEDGLADFLVLEVRELRVDLQLRGQTLQRRVRDLARSALRRHQFRRRQPLGDLANRIDRPWSRQRAFLCHRLDLLVATEDSALSARSAFHVRQPALRTMNQFGMPRTWSSATVRNPKCS